MITVTHSQNMVASKARIRLSAPPPEYHDCADTSSPVRRITVEDCIIGTSHTLTLYISPMRVDQFRVEVDGKPWKDRIGWSRILAGIRKSQPRFSQRMD